MNTGVIYHHLGLGDTIICNGIINNYSDKLDALYIFSKPKFLSSVKFLYRYNYKVNVIPADDNEASVIFKHITTDFKLLLGFGELEKIIKEYNLNFDEAFYKLAGLNFERRFTDFYLVRDYQRESYFLNNQIKNNQEYIFLHDDPSRNLIIDRNYIKNKNLPIITPDNSITDNIFDYCKIIENASEIHVMDSSFKNLAESLNIKTDQLYYHTTYIKRPNTTKSKLKWITV